MILSREVAMQIRELVRKEEIEQAMELAWSVFQEFEAPDYSEAGSKEFHRSIHDRQFLDTLRVYGAFQQNALIGTIATCNHGTHIALFFVSGRFHRRGIGKALFAQACQENFSGKMTVNSSPFAVPVYHQLGFKDSDNEQVVNGLRFTPMECML